MDHWLWAFNKPTTIIIQLPFCGPRELDSFLWYLVIKLACMDTDILKMLINGGTWWCPKWVLGHHLLHSLLIFYFYILLAVCHQSMDRASKALSACTTHITVVMLFFGPASSSICFHSALLGWPSSLLYFMWSSHHYWNRLVILSEIKEIRNAIKRVWWETVDFCWYFIISNYQKVFCELP